MNFRQFGVASTMLVAVVFLASSHAQGQTGVSPRRLTAVRDQVNQIKKLFGQLPPSQRALLSSGLQNMLQLADNFDQASQALGKAQTAKLLNEYLAAGNLSHNASPGGVPVSNPNTDFLFSIMAGFTQSETSTAWCGNNMVVGFNDSNSFFESLLFGPGGTSFSGASYSTDGGSTFRDIGYINPGPNVLNFLAGDPVVNCANKNNFYYTQIFQTGTQVPFSISTAVAFSKSTDGGASWADPVPAVSLDGFSHSIDKPWSTIDPQHPSVVYVTYTDVDFTFTACPSSVRIAIELVRSINGGTTWSAPVTVAQACNTFPDFPFLQGSQVQVDSHSTVYVAWEAFGANREMRIAKSTNFGTSFQPSVKIDNIGPTGDGGSLQGGIRSNEFPTLAIDRSGGAWDGTVYVAWNDGRYLMVPDQEGLNGVYGYADILLSRSRNGGTTWSPAIRVNTDPIALFNGRGTDQYQPGIAVDQTGVVAACWYDRSRDDPFNYQVGRTCGLSPDHGSTWNNSPQTSSIWQPIKSADVFINPYYLGDYDQLSSDFLKLNPGFAGAYGNVTTSGVLVPNQDVFLIRLP